MANRFTTIIDMNLTSAVTTATSTGPSAPGTPGVLTLAAGSPAYTVITLSWSAPSNTGNSAITGYRIKKDGVVLVANTGTTATTYSATGLTNNTSYSFEVAAINAYGTGADGNTVSLTTSPYLVPTAPGVLSLAAGTPAHTNIDLSWSAPSSDGGQTITGYKVEKSTDGSAWSTIVADTGTTATTYSATGLTLNTEYWLRVAAINSIGTGATSNEPNLTTANITPCGAPGTLSLAAGSDPVTGIDLSWSAPSSLGNGTVSGYKIQISTNGSSWSDEVADTSSTATTYSDTGLSSGVQKWYRVAAINQAGVGTYGNEPDLTTVAVADWSTLTNQAYLQESSLTHTNEYGKSTTVAFDSFDRAAGGSWGIGSNGSVSYPGQVTVQKRSGTSWSVEATINRSGNSGDPNYFNFGTGVGLNGTGDTLAIGAQSQLGGAKGYVYVRSGTSWSNQASDLQYSGDTTNNRMGSSPGGCDAYGDWVFFGAEQSNPNNHGACLVWNRSGTTWSQHSKLQNSTVYSNAGWKVGTSVRVQKNGLNTVVNGTRLVVANQGCPEIPGNSSNGDAGACEVWRYNSSTNVWDEEALLRSPTIATNNRFSDASVDINEAGDTIIVVDSNRDEVQIYVRSGTTWSHQKTLTGFVNIRQQYGSAAVTYDACCVGDTGYRAAGNWLHGRGYVYSRSGTSWTQELTFEDNTLNAHSGFGAGAWIKDRAGSTPGYLLMSAYGWDNGTTYHAYGRMSVWTATT